MATIYCRVSTNMQRMSLNMQEHIIRQKATQLGLTVKEPPIKECCSAFKRVPRGIKHLYSRKNDTIIIKSVDRFSRNLNLAKLSSNTIVNNNYNTLYFVEENLCLDSNSKSKEWEKFHTLVKNAQKESKTISKRTSIAKRYMRDMGAYQGGRMPYGYKKIKLSEDDNLQYLHYDEECVPIIKFIVACKMKGVTLAQLNMLLEKCGADVSTPLELGKREGKWEIFDKSMKTINDGLGYQAIANILNEYDVGNGEWKYSHIRTIYKRESRVFNKIKHLV